MKLYINQDQIYHMLNHNHNFMIKLIEMDHLYHNQILYN